MVHASTFITQCLWITESLSRTVATVAIVLIACAGARTRGRKVRRNGNCRDSLRQWRSRSHNSDKQR